MRANNGRDEDETLGEIAEVVGEDELPFERGLLQLYCEERDDNWSNRSGALIQQQTSMLEASSSPPALAVGHVRKLEKSTGEQTWETKERPAAIFGALESAGIFEEATVLDQEREASKEQLRMVHTEEHLQDVEDFHEEAKKVETEMKKEKNPKKRKAIKQTFLDKMYNTWNLFWNTWTLLCAALAVGCVFNGVDHCLVNSGAVLLLIRPPGDYYLGLFYV